MYKYYIQLFYQYKIIIVINIVYIIYKLNTKINYLFYNEINKITNNKNYIEKPIKQEYGSSVSLNILTIDNLYCYNFYNSYNFQESKIYNSFIDKKLKLQHQLKIGTFIFVTSLFIWNLENMYCNKVQFFQLHAWWHILTSIGMYYLNNIIKTYIDLDNQFTILKLINKTT